MLYKKYIALMKVLQLKYFILKQNTIFFLNVCIFRIDLFPNYLICSSSIKLCKIFYLEYKGKCFNCLMNLIISSIPISVSVNIVRN